MEREAQWITEERKAFRADQFKLRGDIMKKKRRVGILGLGGVGGYFGGKLALFYSGDPEVEIVFIARGDTLKNIRTNGLKLKTANTDYVINPSLATDDTNELGDLDVLIVCVKSYSLEDAVKSYQANLSQGAIIITVQNLVNHRECLIPILSPDIKHLNGCVYIISNIEQPGEIVHKSGPGKFYFGSENGDNSKNRWLEELLRKADIDAELRNNIQEIIWKKFLFISSLATTTSYYNQTIGQVLQSEISRKFLVSLMKQANDIALAKGILLGESVISELLELMSNFPFEAKTSMQLDFESGNYTEIGALTEYVVLEGKKLGIATPDYKKAFRVLKSRLMV